MSRLKSYTPTMWAVVVAQLVERAFPIPEVCSLDQDIGIFYNEHIHY